MQLLAATINQKIEAIRRDTGGVTTSIASVSAVITKINEFQSEIAGKVRSQAATSSQMAGAATEAAQSVEEIAGTLATVGDAARRSEEAVGQVGNVSRQLSTTASDLQNLCAKFRV